MKQAILKRNKNIFEKKDPVNKNLLWNTLLVRFDVVRFICYTG